MTDLLWTSFSNVARASVEADALSEALSDTLSNHSLGSFTVVPDSEDWDSWTSAGEWLDSYYLQFWSVKGPNGRGALGTVSTAISFWRPQDDQGSGWAGSRQAKLYVGYTRGRLPHWDVDTLVVDGAGRCAGAHPASAFLWASKHADGVAAGWFYCLRLIEIADRDDLHREILVPLSKLLLNPNDERAFEGCRSLIHAREG